MNPEPDEDPKAGEDETTAHHQVNRQVPPAQPDRPFLPDEAAAEEENGPSLLAAEPHTIISGLGQSRYQHFIIQAGADGQPVELGRGAMGVTYRAIDTTLQRAVALKVISSRLIGNEAVRNRFIREARAAASIRHPNVASIFYLGWTGSSYFYAMELVTGETLEQYIEEKGPLDSFLALDITAQVTSALVAANQAGLVHRDIKPANLILPKDEKGRLIVKVVDFGLVKLAAERGDDSAISDPGTFLGTPRYASPEQFSGGKVDIRSDLYAVGITLWQMLTKAPPFKGSPTQVAAQHLQSPLPLGELRHLAHPIVSLLTHLLEKNPDDRPQTPEELLTILNATRHAIGGPVATIKGVSRPIQSRQPSLRIDRRWYVAVVLLALIGCGALLVRLLPYHPARDQKSVAVLPFDDLGDDKQNAYLSDGITAEVIFQLSKIGELRVISRDSIVRYKVIAGSTRKSMRQIADELEVATLLESNIQRFADRLKVRSILYDANSGRQLWSHSYDREMNDLFAIQSDVAESIAAALQVRLSSDQLDDIQRKPTEKPTAYDLYLRGQEQYELRRKEENERAIALFKQAMEQDPKFALAYAGLANCYIERNARFARELSWVDSAIDLCRTAIAIDSRQARVYTVLARAMTVRNRPAEARDAVIKALELAPNDREANFRAASQLPSWSPDRYARFLKCRSLDPNDPRIAYMLGDTCLLFGDNELRDRWIQRAIRLERDRERKRMMTAEQLVYQKKYLEAFDRLQPLSPNFVGYGPVVEDLRWGCLEHLGRWDDLLQMLSSIEDFENHQAGLLHLVLGLSETRQVEAARVKAERLLTLAQQTSTADPNDAYTAYLVAFCYRFLGHNDQAYALLRRIFPEIIGLLALGRNEYSLTIFSQDREMKELMDDFERANRVQRERNRQMGDS